jgi:hypothetical protein
MPTVSLLNSELDVDVQEMHHHDEYHKEKDAIPTCAFEKELGIAIDTGTELELEQVAIPFLPPPTYTSRRSLTAKVEDTSTLVVHDRIHAVPDSMFKLALGLHVNNTGMSRSEYTSLLEILKMLDNQQLAKVSQYTEVFGYTSPSTT